MGAWNGRSDDEGTSRPLTLLLVPDPAGQGKHAVVEGWAGPDGTAQVAYLSSTRLADRVLILLTRGIDGAWSAEDVTAAASVEAPSVGSGLTGWSGAAGEVAIGTGNGGSTSFDARTGERGRWIRLAAPNGGSPANEFIVYAASPGGAEFMVAAASVREPGAPAGPATPNLVYGGADGHLYHLTQEPSSASWQVADLTLLTQARPWQPGSDLAAWADGDGQRHVSFRGNEGQLYDLVEAESGSSWRVEQPDEPLPPFFLGSRRGPSAGAATTWALADIRGLACTGPDGLVRIRISPGGAGPWRWVEPVADRRGLAAVSRGALAGWADPATGTASVAVISGRRVYLLSSPADGSDWTVTDLATAASAPPAAGFAD